jgi:AGZA family xanthine/uracil permease-like MFS transporter
MAPGMGENALFAYTLCVGVGIPWETLLGMLFIMGVLDFLVVVSCLNIRKD